MALLSDDLVETNDITFIDAYAMSRKQDDLIKVVESRKRPADLSTTCRPFSVG